MRYSERYSTHTRCLVSTVVAHAGGHSGPLQTNHPRPFYIFPILPSSPTRPTSDDSTSCLHRYTSRTPLSELVFGFDFDFVCYNHSWLLLHSESRIFKSDIAPRTIAVTPLMEGPRYTRERGCEAACWSPLPQRYGDSEFVFIMFACVLLDHTC